jgi:hypothetical protein
MTVGANKLECLSVASFLFCLTKCIAIVIHKISYHYNLGCNLGFFRYFFVFKLLLE